MIRQCFQGIEPAWIQNLKEELLQVTRQKYWEVSERRRNIDFAPEGQKEKLCEFFDHLLETRRTGKFLRGKGSTWEEEGNPGAGEKV